MYFCTIFRKKRIFESMNELTKKWQECQRILSENLTQSAYQTWFAPIAPVSYENQTLTLRVKSQFIVEYIEENYVQLLSRVLFRVFGIGTKLEYRALIDSVSGAGSTIPSEGLNIEQVKKQQELQPDLLANVAISDFDSQLNKGYTFDSFVQGEPNKLARTAGLAIAKQPGYTAFNPLFIYGGSGVGKTHLANAIGNQTSLLHPDKKVLYVSANTFKLQYQDASLNKRIPDFLNFYQSIDVLIVDDIQYFAGLDRTQDTFFHIFNYLQQSHKQLILTSDRAPIELRDIQDRLLTRFKWGLLALIEQPDLALRRDILVSKMHKSGIVLSDEIIDYIASKVTSSVRDLEGVIASLMAYSTLTDAQIDMNLTKQVVSRIVSVQPKPIDIPDIIGAVCESFNLPSKMVLGSTRSKEVAEARQVAMYLAKQLTNHSLKEIGAGVGHRNHATVIHSITCVSKQLDDNTQLRQRIAKIKAALQ